MGDQSPCDSYNVLEPMLAIYCCLQCSETFFPTFEG